MSRTRILLVPAPCVCRGQLLPYVPYGLLSLQAVARQSDGKVDILDLPRIFSNGAFENSDQLATAVAEVVKLERYAAVGLSTMCSSFHHSLGIVVGMRQRHPDLAIWLGGPHASVSAESILKRYPEVDAVFVGEGEATFRDLLERRAEPFDTVLANLPGVLSRSSSFRPREPMRDLDELPYIDGAADYFSSCVSSHDSASSGVPLEAARGCPGRCTFCSTRLFWGNRVRHKSDRRLIMEMRRVQALTGRKLFSLIGDNLAAPASRLLSFAESMSREASQFRWTCSLTIDSLCPHDLDVLWAGGCRGMFVGLESGSQTTLDRIRKAVDLQHSVRLLREAIDKGFSIDTSLIVGFPWETSSDIKKTYALHIELLELGVNRSQVLALCPLPGTDLQRAYEASTRSWTGGSKASSDDLPYGPGATALIERCPELFTQFGCIENGNIDPVELRATVDAAGTASAYYRRRAKSLVLD